MVKKNFRLAVLFIIFILLFVPAIDTSAQDPAPWNFKVNDTRDLNDYGHNDVCDAVYGNEGEECTLRAAIHEANLCQGSVCPDGVTILVPPGTYTLTIPPAGDNNNSTGDLDITPPNELPSYIIEGTDPNNPPVIDGNGLDRVFQINNSDTMITLRYLIIRGGTLTVSAGNTNEKDGAGISNYGHLTLENVIIENNQINCTDVSINVCEYGVGGGISSVTQLQMNNSTVRNNSAFRGGGIFTSGVEEVRILNSTISGNHAVYGGGGIINYGNLFNIENSTVSDNSAGSFGGIVNQNIMNLYNVTIASNVSSSGGYANLVNTSSGTIKLSNSVIAYPIGPYLTNNCENYDGNWTTIGKNLSSDSSCEPGVNDIPNIDPKLTPLAWLGGPTMTRGLLPGSPAHDAGTTFCLDSSNYVVTVDQRGANRDSHCDLGAFEGIAHGVYLPLIRR